MPESGSLKVWKISPALTSFCSCDMDGFSPPDMPRYEVRLVSLARYVIDVHWPHGEVEQLIGVYVTRRHAQRWLANVDLRSIKPLQFDRSVDSAEAPTNAVPRTHYAPRSL